jgi:hypothetical protein
MSLSRATPVVAVPLLLALGLAGCTAAPEPIPEDYVSATEEPTTPAEVTPNPIEPDMTLLVRTIATAPNGAQLSLEMQVHRASPWDYVGTQSLPAALIEDCGATLDADLFAAETWAFTRINVTSITTGASKAEWPSDLAVSIEPSAQNAMIAGRGMLVSDPAAESPCLANKSFIGAGRGGLSLGIPGDAASLTGWAGHSYGFVAPGVTFSACEFQATGLGSQLGADVNWTPVSDDTTCVIGPTTQTSEF